MKTNKKFLFVGFLAILMIAWLSGLAISQNRVVIIGTVNADLQIIADNDQVYEIGDTEKGEELSGLVDEKVKVTGTVEEYDGAKVITVTSYEVIKE
ncbi:MAG: hypothetical protein HQ551_08650 [Desulfobacteraceae bacterium]|nr:hypothetical protein [Desulfobacteraceae bacterium]